MLWGMLHGLVLALERVFAKSVRKLPQFIGVLVTFHFVCFAWIFFRSANLEGALSYINGLTALTFEGFLLTPFIALLIGLTMLFQFTPSDLVERAGAKLSAIGLLPRTVIFAMGLLVIQWISPDDVAPFIYFRF